MSEILKAIVPLIESGGPYAFWLGLAYILVNPLMMALGMTTAIIVIYKVMATIRQCNPPKLCYGCEYELQRKLREKS